MGAGTGGLALVARLARQLNAPLPADQTLRALLAELRAGLGAGRVALWMREPNAAGFTRVADPADPAPPEPVASLETLPPAPAARRWRLVHDGEWLGLLEVEAPPPEPLLLEAVADLLAPFLASLELSEDLALEVAERSREVESQRLFTSLIIDSLPVGLYVIDRDYRVQVWNRRRELGPQGRPRAEVLGHVVFDVLTRQPREEFQAEFDRVFASGELAVVEVDVAVGEQLRTYRNTKVPMRLGDGGVTHVIVIGEDVTEARAMTERILQSEKLAAIGQLAAGVMHEINNPLATIGACVAALEGRLDALPGAARPVFEEYLGLVDKEVVRCTGIVNGLLDFSRPKARRQAAVALNALVIEALDLLRHHPRYKRVQVVRELEADLPDAVGNAEQLVQAVLALLLNALDALESGGRLTVRTRRPRARGDEVVLEVEDTGMGIPRAEQTKIFEPFYTTKPPGRGTGLGLSICYGIIEAHRGRIEVESAPGRGATFRVALPVFRLDAAAPPPAVAGLGG
ncbi:MAG: ATP-binding protein [Gemmatimonadales bacterium]|nr:ATP-binding protein [Gemmatimonadales bacterium]